MDRITLKIDGMVCSMCEVHICDAIRKAPKYRIEKNTVRETLVIPRFGRLVGSERFPGLFYDPAYVLRGGAPVPRDKTASHVRVMEAAREEFTEYGYENASMRRIGDRCGMTAAGLYRHCVNKEDLFREVVSPSVRKIEDWLEVHIDKSLAAADGYDPWKDSAADLMREVIYPNMEEYRLLLTGSRGTAYEDFLQGLTEKYLDRMLAFLHVLQEKGRRPVDPGELRLLLKAYTSAMLEPVLQGYSEEKACRCLETLETFFLSGWKQLLGIQDRDI